MWYFQINNNYLILIIFVIVTSVTGQCLTGDWDCDNGECISEEKRCDGIVNCGDGSDEISKNCLGFSKCQAFAFKCTYGACINGGFKCNGRQDCADNSDELICSETRQLDLQGTCRKNEIQCFHSKECISRYNMCDGYRHCSDGSDETVDMCADFECPKIAFQCGNGACINGNAKCNSTTECLDNSDEAWLLCGYPRGKSRMELTPTTTTRRITTTTITTNKCKVSEKDDSLVVRLHPTNYTIPLGYWVEDYETIHLECTGDYIIKGQTSLLCRNGRWSGSFPACTKDCDGRHLRGLSIYYICRNRLNIEANCETVAPNGEVEIKCNAGYEGISKATTTLQCLPNGRFSSPRPRCKLSCGRESSGIELTNKGLPVKSSEVPWLVAIYQKIDTTFHYICAGTIISPSIILTAAHCFWNEEIKSIDIAAHFRVAAGKYYRDYHEVRDRNAQFNDVIEIIVSTEFNHANNNFYRDIAIVKLKDPFEFTKNISSVCMDFAKDIGDSYVGNDIPGSVVGWGKSFTQEVVLQRVLVKTKSYSKCREHIQSLRGDKFCLEYEYESEICRGDSGAGFIRLNSYTHRFELLGIVSYAPSTIMGCVQNGYITVTNINSMPQELQQKVEQFKKNDEYLF